MMKTSYHIEKLLFIPVKDDQITGIPSIESGNSQTILEDIDILGDNISSENNAMLGVSVNCPNDKSSCSLNSCNPDLNPSTPVTGCTAGLASTCTSIATPNFTVSAYTYIVLSLSGTPSTALSLAAAERNNYTYPITSNLLNYIGSSITLSFIDDFGDSRTVNLNTYGNNLFYGYLSSGLTYTNDNTEREKSYSGVTFNLKVNGHFDDSFSGVLVNNVFRTSATTVFLLDYVIRTDMALNINTLNKTRKTLSTKFYNINGGTTSLYKFPDTLNPMLYTGTKWTLYDKKSYDEGHYTKDYDNHFMYYTVGTDSAFTNSISIFPATLRISSPFNQLYFKRERPGIDFPENTSIYEESQLLPLDMSNTSFKDIDSEMFVLPEYYDIKPNGQILSGKDIDKMYPSYFTNPFIGSGLCFNHIHYKDAFSNSFITSGAMSSLPGTELVKADKIISESYENPTSLSTKLIQKVIMISSAMTWLF